MRRASFRAALCAAAMLAAAPASALDLSWSGFGTASWSQSNRDWTYDRNIDERGTADRDSVLGLQVDARLAAEWSATLQVKASQARRQDEAWQGALTWGFVAWRPSDDWLLRVGRMRAPLFLYSEQIDVGATHDLARLPSELYAMSPVNDFDGVYATKTWDLGDDELALDLYAGRRDTEQRIWSRDGGQTLRAGANYIPMRLGGEGFALSYRQPEGVWRGSVYRVRLSPTDGGAVVKEPVHVEFAPGVGYYDVQNAEKLKTMTTYVVTLGMERRLGDGWRVAAEYARMLPRETVVGPDVSAGYVAVFRELGAVTPYLSLARLRGSGASSDWYRRLTETRLPDGTPYGDAIYAGQREVAETMMIGDQHSVALGASWSVASGQKLKLEWQRTAIGQMSKLVDTPAGSGTVHDTHVDVWSLSYHFVF